MVLTSRLARDYYEEVQTCVEVALVNWNVKHLSIWSELVQPAALALDEAHTDVVEMEECTLDAQFQEVRSKISHLNFIRLIVDFWVSHHHLSLIHI